MELARVKGLATPQQEGGVGGVVLACEGQQGRAVEAMTPKDGAYLLLGSTRRHSRPPGRSRIGFHSPIFPKPPSERMTGPPDGYPIGINREQPADLGQMRREGNHQPWMISATMTARDVTREWV
jgi:hypothetical protein